MTAEQPAMTTKTAAEQVADERNPLTAAEQMAIALSDAIGHFEWHDLHQPGRVGHILYRDMRAALERWRAEQDSDGWLPIETAPTDRNVHVHYLNSHGKHRVIKACKVERYTVEADDDCTEYDEANDRYTLLPGWWELIDNWGDYSHVLVSEGEPDFWRELPPYPKAASQGGEA